MNALCRESFKAAALSGEQFFNRCFYNITVIDRESESTSSNLFDFRAAQQSVNGDLALLPAQHRD